MKIVKYLVIFVVVIVVAFVGIGFLLPGSYRVERSLVIQAPPQVVFAQINDFANWPAWSPWVERDPEMDIKFSANSAGEGATQEWSSETEGSGKIAITKSEAPRLLEYELYFADFDSTASGGFTLEPSEGGTEVTWGFWGEHGMNPIMRWFGLAYEKLIGPDFERGLSNLKKVSEALPAKKPDA